MILKRVAVQSVRMRVWMPLELKQRFRFVRNGECFEVDVIVCTRGIWWRRDIKKEEWATLDLGPYVLAVKLMV